MSSQLPWHALKLQIYPRINLRWLPPRNQVLHSELLNSYLNQRYHSSDLLLVFWCNLSEWIGCRALEIVAGRVLSATTRKGTHVALHLRQLFHFATSAWNFVWKCESWDVLCWTVVKMHSSVCSVQVVRCSFTVVQFAIWHLCSVCAGSFLLAAFGLSYLSPLVNQGSVHHCRQQAR